ncbi:3470_t:CDS:2, partial [Racocetra fulgida]
EFYYKTPVEDWTYTNLMKYYRSKSKHKDKRKVLDCIKKDLEEVANSNSDMSYKKKAQDILDDWKESSPTVLNCSSGSKIEMRSTQMFNDSNIILGINQGSKDASIKEGELSTNIIKNKMKVSVPIDQDEEVVTTSNSDHQNEEPTRSTNVDNISDNNISGDESEIPNLTDFDKAYYKLDPRKMWKLKSGTVVEKVLYEYARSLSYESCLHSFIINDTDEEAKSLFSEEDWNEIFAFELKKMPKIDKSIINLMKKYSVTDLTEFRKIIFDPFLPTGTSYSNKEHFDLNYIHVAYKIMHTFWEDDDNFALDPSKLEGWYQLNIWGPLIDSAFRNSSINLIRVDGMSRASSDRKNQDNHRTNRKKIGRKGDGIFRLKESRLEFGAIEAGRKWEANRLQLLTMDIPMGYISRIQHHEFREVTGSINNLLLGFVLKDILRARSIITQTLELIQESKSNINDLDDSDNEGEASKG